VIKKEYWPYLVPFGAFLLLTYLGVGLSPHGLYVFYPIKTLVVGGILYAYRRDYPELCWRLSARSAGLASLLGGVVFVIWVVPDDWYPHLGSSSFDPYFYGNNWIAVILIVFRLAGAVLVVPLFEELFWRSFIVRWLIDEDFRRLPIGAFTWFSCLATVIAFGFEHNQWLVGLLAGVAYNALLYYKKDLVTCVLAHAVTNLCLGIYVLLTQQWGFW